MTIQIISKSNQNVRNIIRVINTFQTGGARSFGPLAILRPLQDISATSFKNAGITGCRTLSFGHSISGFTVVSMVKR